MNKMKVKYNFDCEGVPFMRTDWDIFKCAVFHVLSNAIKHGQKGSEIEIVVSQM